MDYESLLELVKKRRSIRKFKPEPIPDEYVDQIIEVARWSPSGANSQPWEFIIVKKPELKQKIVQYLNEYNNLMRKLENLREPELSFKWTAPGFVNAPVFIVVCGDTRMIEAYPLNKVLQPKGRDIFISSMANTFLYMTLAAATLGLGAEWVSATATPYVQPFTKDLLGIPKELEIYEMLAVGYPDIEPKPRPLRLKEEIIHYEQYDRSRYRTDQQIREAIIKFSRHTEI